MAMTWFSRSASRLLACIFGRVEVRPYHFPRALRIFRAILEENDLNPDYLPEPAYDALMTEVFERARIRDANEVLRWKHLLSEIILTGEMVCSTLKGTVIEDQRVRSILILHKVI
jgi:hypothetical protein